MEKNPQIKFARRPQGLPTEQDLVFEEGPMPKPGPGEVLVRNRFLSLDPYMRGRMNEGKSYVPPFTLGATLEGGCVGQVVEGPGFQPGEWVYGNLQWAHFSVASGQKLVRIDTKAAPASYYLGALGMPGTTAWVGCSEIAVVKPGETFVVAAASGAVGAVAGQLAREMGAYVVGIAGGAEKCAHVKNELHFDACIDHHAKDFAAQLKAACPKGIDVYFENVGGEVQRLVFPLLNEFARVAFCGMVAEYNDAEPAPGPNLMSVVKKRLHLQGFIVSDHPRAFVEWPKIGAQLLKDKKLFYKEDVVRGLRNAPAAFAGMLQGKNFGKVVVELE